MNKIIIGLADKTEALYTKQEFLLIDDGEIADAFLKRYPRAKIFDPHKHSFNPLKGINVPKAREFADIVFGSEGKDTLTVRNGKRALTRLLLKAGSLDRIVAGKGDDEKEAVAALDALLLSPVLKRVLCPTNPLVAVAGKSVVAKIDRAELGEDDAKILASLLISQFKGQIIIPDFGFYARDFHASLIRENRLIAGLYSLSELDKKLRQLCLLMDKEGRQCTYEDAEVLAQYAGWTPHTEGFKAYVDEAMKGRA